MRINRRHFLQGGTAMAAALSLPASAEASVVTLTAKPGRSPLAPPGYPDTDIWGYNGDVPGPVIRVPQGGMVRRRLLNQLPQPTSIHWHGIRIENRMDGVAGVTQSPVEPGDQFDYAFTVPDAGTYWYHPHHRTWEQAARGLYGALIVEETNPPQVDRDEVLLIDDWRLTAEAAIDDSFGNMGDWSHAGRLGNWSTINGRAGTRLSVAQNERLRLRLVNVANARIFNVVLQGVEGWIMALDGQPLDTPQPLGEMTIAPAQRVDVMVDVTAAVGAQAGIGLIGPESIKGIMAFDVQETLRAEPSPAPNPLPSNGLTEPGLLSDAARAELVMEGGAMGRMSGAMLNGERLGMRELVDQGMVWAFNGVAGRPEAPLMTLERGRTALVKLVNDTRWPHAMHLHGHHFRVAQEAGGFGPWRDTILMHGGEEISIAFVADNPGDWLFHCHMLEHAAAGMTSWIRVV